MCKTQCISAQKDGCPLKKLSTSVDVQELLWLGYVLLTYENSEEEITHFPHLHGHRHK
jgi:hypothetical protein